MCLYSRSSIDTALPQFCFHLNIKSDSPNYKHECCERTCKIVKGAIEKRNSHSNKENIEFIVFVGHTKTSLLRTLSTSGGFNSPEWLLPETKELFEQQWLRQQKVDKGMWLHLPHSVFVV